MLAGAAGAKEKEKEKREEKYKEKKPPKPQNVLSPDASLERLLKGNARYVDGRIAAS